MDEESELSDFGMEPEVAVIPAIIPVEQNIKNPPVIVEEINRVESEMNSLPEKNKIKQLESVEPVPMNYLGKLQLLNPK